MSPPINITEVSSGEINHDTGEEELNHAQEQETKREEGAELLLLSYIQSLAAAQGKSTWSWLCIGWYEIVVGIKRGIDAAGA